MKTLAERCQEFDAGLREGTVKLGPQVRAAQEIRLEDVDELQRSVRMSFASGYEVERFFGIERLVMSPEAADLSRGIPGIAHRAEHGAGIPLQQHLGASLLGVTRDFEFKDGRLFGTTFYKSNTDLANEYFDDLVRGFRPNVSIMYWPRRLKLVGVRDVGEDAGPDEFLPDGFFGLEKAMDAGKVRVFDVVSWELLETSSVEIPADPTVGPGREFEEAVGLRAVRVLMPRQAGVDPPPAAAAPEERGEETEMEKTAAAEVKAPEVDVAGVREAAKQDTIATQSERISELAALGRKFAKFGGEEAATEAIRAGTSVVAFRSAMLDKVPTDEVIRTIQDDQEKDPGIGMRDKDLQQYSLVRLIGAMTAAAEGKRDAWKKAGFEREMSVAMQQQLGREAREGGEIVPYDVLADRRFLRGRAAHSRVMAGAQSRTTVTATGGGVGLVGTDLMESDFIGLLYARSVLASMGFGTVEGLVGNVDFPKMTAGATSGWIGEDTAALEDTTTTYGVVAATPKTLSIDVPITRRMLLQSTPGIENLTRADVTRQLLIELDDVGIEGGGANEPSGILNAAFLGAGPDLGAAGGTVTWDVVTRLEEEVAVDNADMGSLGYITNPKVRRAMKNEEKVSGSGRYIWDTRDFDRPLNEYPVGISTLVPSDLVKGGSGATLSALIFGNFGDAFWALWSGLDLKVDPWTDSQKGGVRVIAFQDVDVVIRHDQSFAASQEISTV